MYFRSSFGCMNCTNARVRNKMEFLQTRKKNWIRCKSALRFHFVNKPLVLFSFNFSCCLSLENCKMISLRSALTESQKRIIFCKLYFHLKRKVKPNVLIAIQELFVLFCWILALHCVGTQVKYTYRLIDKN